MLGIAVSGVLLLLMRSVFRSRPLTGLDQTAFKTYALALAAGISLLAVPLFPLLWRTKLDDVPARRPCHRGSRTRSPVLGRVSRCLPSFCILTLPWCSQP